MGTLYDLQDLAQRAGVKPEELRELESCVRRQYGHDEMLVELRLLRTLRAIESGHASASGAIEELRDAPVLRELEAHLSRSGLAASEQKLVLDVLAAQLSPAERLLLVLYYYEQMTLSKIAYTLGVSEAVATRMHAELIERMRNFLSPAVSTRIFRKAS